MHRLWRKRGRRIRPSDKDLVFRTVFFLLCTRGAGSAFQQPAIQSILPQLVPAEELVRTNGWMQLRGCCTAGFRTS